MGRKQKPSEPDALKAQALSQADLACRITHIPWQALRRSEPAQV